MSSFTSAKAFHDIIPQTFVTIVPDHNLHSARKQKSVGNYDSNFLGSCSNTANAHLFDVYYYPGMKGKEQRQSLN